MTINKQRATFTVILVALGYDVEMAEEFASSVQADTLSDRIMSHFHYLSDSDKRGVLTLVTQRQH